MIALGTLMPVESIGKKDIEMLALGTHPMQENFERTLVMMAREGSLKGVVTKPPRYSATTIQWGADCLRKFYWPTLAGLEEPPSPQQKFGTTLHAFQERYLKTGEMPPRHTPEGILASIGLPLLPQPGTPGLYAEEPFEVYFEGLPVVLTGTRDFGVDPQELDAKGFMLGDHKTKRNKRYPMTKAWLAGNIQSNIYAFTKFAELYAKGFHDLRVVDKQWIYYYKEEKQADKLRQVDSLDDVGEQFETKIKPIVLTLAQMIEEAPRIDDVPLPKDRSVCDAYGGCKHKARCFGFGKGEVQMGVLAKGFSKEAIAAKIGSKPSAAQGAGSAINPPAAAPPKAPPPKSLAVVQTEEEEVVDETQAEEEADAETVEEEEAPAPKATRQKKAKPAPAPVARESGAVPGANAEHDYWLFVGCGPEKGFDAVQISAEELAGPAQAETAARLNSDHYRSGQGTYGVLETTFAAWMEQNAVTGAVVIDPGSNVSRDIVGLLRTHATAVIGRRM